MGFSYTGPSTTAAHTHGVAASDGGPLAFGGTRVTVGTTNIAIEALS